MLEFEFGITEEELRGALASSEPNDTAFCAAFAGLIEAWRDGKAQVHLHAVWSLMNDRALIEVRLLEPSLN